MQNNITPLTEESMNSNLINTNQLEVQNKQKDVDVDQYFVEENSSQINSFTITFCAIRIAVISVSVIALCACTITPLSIKELDTLYKIIIISSGIIFTLILLMLFNNKLILIKDTSNKKVIIKVINFLCFVKKKNSFRYRKYSFLCRN